MTTDLTRHDVEKVVLAVFSEVFGHPAPHGLDTGPTDVARWGSLAQVRLVHIVERRLGSVTEERLLTSRATLRDLAESITKVRSDLPPHQSEPQHTPGLDSPPRAAETIYCPFDRCTPTSDVPQHKGEAADD